MVPAILLPCHLVLLLVLLKLFKRKHQLTSIHTYLHPHKPAFILISLLFGSWPLFFINPNLAYKPKNVTFFLFILKNCTK